MRRAAILIPRFDSGDAVGNDAAGMASVLSANGFEVRIFAGAWQSGSRVHRIQKATSFIRSTEDLVILHYTVAWREGLDAFNKCKCKRILKYHNITPSEFFEPYNTEYARICRLGREWLPETFSADRILCDSQFNVADIVTEGADASRCNVVAPFHNLDQLDKIHADTGILGKYAMGYPKPVRNIFSVGRIVPNKRYERLIDAFAIFHHEEPHSRLILAGRIDPALKSYNDSLHKLVYEYGLSQNILFTGGVTDSGLKAYFLSAHVYAVASDHEGFCVPVIESMKLKLPVVGCGVTAARETLGNTGIYWNDFDSYRMAAAWKKLCDDRDASQLLTSLAHARFESEFSSDRIRARFLEFV